MAPTIEIGIEKNILLYYRELEHDQYHRYRSWEHCYSFFQNIRPPSCTTEQIIDTAALHLAFYLASWGMIRGSSELLQKDYKVHIQIVQEILSDEYRQLWTINLSSQPETDLVWLLAERLKQTYKELKVSPTDTLVTKVMLGTLGCTPAYDIRFKKGATYWNKELLSAYAPKLSAKFSRRSYEGVVDFCLQHEHALRQVQSYIAQHSVTYPFMKLADMYFWMLGYQLDMLKRAKKS